MKLIACKLYNKFKLVVIMSSLEVNFFCSNLKANLNVR